MRRLILFTVLITALTVTTAMADTIANRFGFTGRVGFATPLEDDFINNTSDAKTGTAWNAGVIYGFNDNLAAELEFSYLSGIDIEIGGTKAYEAKLTDYSLGLQYRFMPDKPLVPYVGIGVDFINGDLDHVAINSYDMDWTYGGHVNAGLDWFLTKGIALSADFRCTAAASGDVNRGPLKVTEYDPFWFQGTFGFRLILPEKW